MLSSWNLAIHIFKVFSKSVFEIWVFRRLYGNLSSIPSWQVLSYAGAAYGIEEDRGEGDGHCFIFFSLKYTVFYIFWNLENPEAHESSHQLQLKAAAPANVKGHHRRRYMWTGTLKRRIRDTENLYTGWIDS